MKKTLSLLLAVVLAIGLFTLTGCGKSLDNIPSLTVVREQGEEWANERLKGYKLQNLEQIWGETHGMLSGMYGLIWQVPDDQDYVIVYFAHDDSVEDVKYVHILKAAILESTEDAIVVEPCEGEIERDTAERISVSLAETEKEYNDSLTVGATVLIEYNGALSSSDPAQLIAQHTIRTYEE